MFGSSTPAAGAVDSGDSTAVNVGMAFSVDQPGYITGVRFYKAAANTGTHVGDLWSASGTELAQATFTGETASGWQLVSFSTPVAVSVGTTYVVSYTDPNGHYSATSGTFSSANVNSPPLYGLATTTTPDGLYSIGSSPAFPTLTYQGDNYWVDPVFNLVAARRPVRLGLISDVHGNSVALRASLNVLAEVGIARLYFLGDVVGYLPGDGACLELLHEAEAHCQQGNHEAMLLDVGTKPGSDSIYRLECARRRLGAASLEALGRWPLARTVEVDGRRLLLVHGTPDDPVHGRLYPDGVLEEAVRPGFDAVFMGQTHRPFVATFGDALVANVGSVGLPAISAALRPSPCTTPRLTDARS